MLRSKPLKITRWMPFLRFDIFICNFNIYGIFCRLWVFIFVNFQDEEYRWKLGPFNIKLTWVIQWSVLSTAHGNSMLEVYLDELTGTLQKSQLHSTDIFKNWKHFVFCILKEIFMFLVCSKIFVFIFTKTRIRILPFSSNLVSWR